MKIFGISDLHLSSKQPVARTDDVLKVQADKFKSVLLKVKEEDGILLVAGDFFDRPRDWYLLPEVMQWLIEYEVPIYVVYGQHDTYMYNEKTRHSTSLGVLEKAGLVQRLSSQPEIFADDSNDYWSIALYGASYGEDIPEAKREKGVINILVVHKEIGNHNFLDCISNYVFMADHKEYDLIVAGDIHEFLYESKAGGQRQFINTGPMVRRKAEMKMHSHEPRFFEYDTEDQLKIKIHKIRHSPAEEVLTRDHIERVEERSTILDNLIESIKQGGEYSKWKLAEVIQELIKEHIDSEDMKVKIKEVISILANDN